MNRFVILWSLILLSTGSGMGGNDIIISQKNKDISRFMLWDTAANPRFIPEESQVQEIHSRNQRVFRKLNTKLRQRTLTKTYMNLYKTKSEKSLRRSFIGSFFLFFGLITAVILISVALLPLAVGTKWLIPSIIAMFLLVGGLILLSIGKLTSTVRKGMEPEDIPNGIAAVGTITNFQQGSSVISIGVTEYYEMLIDLNIEAPDGSLWPVRIRQYVPLAQLNRYQIGRSISVKYDPNNRSKVVLNPTFP